MAEESTYNTTQEDSLELENVTSRNISKKFGKTEDYIELHIYNSNNQLLYSETNFTDYTLPNNTGLSDNINVDPKLILTDRGYSFGQYRVKLNILRNKVFNTDQYPFSVKEISDNRREIRSIALSAENNLFDSSVSSFISEIDSSPYFKEFSLNFNNDILVPSINILLNKDPLKHELLLKTLNPLPREIRLESIFKVVEEIVDPIFIDVDLGSPEFVDSSIELGEPNFNIDVRSNSSIPSSFKNYNEILKYSVTSSYQHLLSKLEKNEAELNIQYDYIRPVSESSIEESYHFENFTHFSSATERLKNFQYKLKLIELYDSQITKINSIPSTNSKESLSAKEDVNTKKESLIKGFDGYEQFLYFESGTYSWPKQNNSAPYNLYSITSSQANTWLGNENSAYSNYGGQLLSASLYDRQNPHNLNKLIPTHILENGDNSLYVGFVDMVGQHFDQIWTYIKHLTEINNADNIRGISKDLVYFQLKSLGIETFDQFENSDLAEYILGQGSGSNQYDVTNFISSSGVPSETMVTASNVGSIPKQDIAKEIWKRLYHNAPYLLKTKGTERGIKALMSCYGIPSSILNVKEYGGNTILSGPLKDLKTADVYKTFTYEKASLAFTSISKPSVGERFFIKTDFSSSLTNALSSSAKTITFRIKPDRYEGKSQHLFSLSGSGANTLLMPSLVLNAYTGSTDISSSGDASQYGKIELHIGGGISSSTANFPVYNGDFWNIFIGTKGTSGSASHIHFGAYQANFNKNVSFYTSSAQQLESERAKTFGDPFFEGNNHDIGAHMASFCGITPNDHSSFDYIENLKYSGSLQEVRFYFGEFLSHDTRVKQALEPFMYAGNTISSSYDTLVLRLPLGSNDQQSLQSFHPNINVNYLPNAVSSSALNVTWKEVVENHYLPTPDTVGASMTSEKVRIDEGTIDNNVLVVDKNLETSTLDRQPQDFEDLGIFFSPTNEINEDIIYQLGAFRLDDFIGSPLPSAQTASIYEDLKDIKDQYFKRVQKRYNYGAFIKQIQYIDHTLFKLIEQFVPFKANTKTGLLIEPHFLERSKFQRELPSRNDGQTMVTGSHQTIEFTLDSEYGEGTKLYTLATSSANAFGVARNIRGQWDPGTYVPYHSNKSPVTSSKGEKKDLGTNASIDIYEDYLDPFSRDENAENSYSHQGPIIPNSTGSGVFRRKKSNALLGNAVKGKLSNRYYKYAEYPISTSSLYSQAP